MIHIHIETPTVESMQEELVKLLGGLNKGTVKDLIAAVPEAKVDLTGAEAAPHSGVPEVEGAAKPVEAPAAKEPELEDQMSIDDIPVEETEEQAIEAEKQPSMEETRAALNALRAKKGPKAVKEILTAHGVSSFVDLKPSEYAAVIEEAKANA